MMQKKYRILVIQGISTIKKRGSDFYWNAKKNSLWLGLEFWLLSSRADECIVSIWSGRRLSLNFGQGFLHYTSSNPDPCHPCEWTHWHQFKSYLAYLCCMHAWFTVAGGLLHGVMLVWMLGLSFKLTITYLTSCISMLLKGWMLHYSINLSKLGCLFCGYYAHRPSAHSGITFFTVPRSCCSTTGEWQQASTLLYGLYFFCVCDSQDHQNG